MAECQTQENCNVPILYINCNANSILYFTTPNKLWTAATNKKYSAVGDSFNSCVNKETTNHYSQSRCANKKPWATIHTAMLRIAMSINNITLCAVYRTSQELLIIISPHRHSMWCHLMGVSLTSKCFKHTVGLQMKVFTSIQDQSTYCTILCCKSETKTKLREICSIVLIITKTSIVLIITKTML